MPELPEVETVRAELSGLVVGKKVEEAKMLREKNLLSDPKVFSSNLANATIISIKRKGKCLRFDFDNGYSLYSHLRMEGKYFLKKAEDEYDRFDLMDLRFTDGTSLRYNDVRKFGKLSLEPTKDSDTSSPFSKIGPEPFDVDGAYLRKIWKGKSTPVKIALLDQEKISGIGNIYDSEILYFTKIHPTTPVKDIPLEDCENIIKESRRILHEAILAGGSTIKSFNHGGIDGMFQTKLAVYGKEGEPCPTCDRPLQRRFIGQRSAYFCPMCQKAPDGKLILGLTGPIHCGKSTLAAYLEKLGYLHFDADKVASKLYDEKEVAAQIKDLLGDEAYAGNKLNRDYVREALSIDKKKKKAVQKLLYPLVKKKAKEFIAKAKNDSKILLDVPLLYESEMEDLCSYVILLDAPLEQRKQRLEKEGRPTESLVKLNEEYNVEAKKKKADYFIDNDATIDGLKQAFDRLGF